MPLKKNIYKFTVLLTPILILALCFAAILFSTSAVAAEGNFVSYDVSPTASTPVYNDIDEFWADVVNMNNETGLTAKRIYAEKLAGSFNDGITFTDAERNTIKADSRYSSDLAPTISQLDLETLEKFENTNIRLSSDGNLPTGKSLKQIQTLTLCDALTMDYRAGLIELKGRYETSSNFLYTVFDAADTAGNYDAVVDEFTRQKIALDGYVGTLEKMSQLSQQYQTMLSGITVPIPISLIKIDKQIEKELNGYPDDNARMLSTKIRKIYDMYYNVDGIDGELSQPNPSAPGNSERELFDKLFPAYGNKKIDDYIIQYDTQVMNYLLEAKKDITVENYHLSDKTQITAVRDDLQKPSNYLSGLDTAKFPSISGVLNDIFEHVAVLQNILDHIAKVEKVISDILAANDSASFPALSSRDRQTIENLINEYDNLPSAYEQSLVSNISVLTGYIDKYNTKVVNDAISQIAALDWKIEERVVAGEVVKIPRISLGDKQSVLDAIGNLSDTSRYIPQMEAAGEDTVMKLVNEKLAQYQTWIEKMEAAEALNEDIRSLPAISEGDEPSNETVDLVIDILDRYEKMDDVQKSMIDPLLLEKLKQYEQNLYVDSLYDAATDTTVTASVPKTFRRDYQLSAVVLNSEKDKDSYENIMTVFKSRKEKSESLKDVLAGLSLSYVIDYKIVKGNEVLKFDGVTFTVKVKIPSHLTGKETYKMFHLGEGNVVTVLDATTQDGYLSFETDSFSSFGFLIPTSFANWLQDNPWFWAVIGLLALLLLVLVFLFIYFISRRNKDDEEEEDDDGIIEDVKAEASQPVVQQQQPQQQYFGYPPQMIPYPVTYYDFVNNPPKSFVTSTSEVYDRTLYSQNEPHVSEVYTTQENGHMAASSYMNQFASAGNFKVRENVVSQNEEAEGVDDFADFMPTEAYSGANTILEDNAVVKNVEKDKLKAADDLIKNAGFIPDEFDLYSYDGEGELVNFESDEKLKMSEDVPVFEDKTIEEIQAQKLKNFTAVGTSKLLSEEEVFDENDLIEEDELLQFMPASHAADVLQIEEKSAEPEVVNKAPGDLLSQIKFIGEINDFEETDDEEQIAQDAIENTAESLDFADESMHAASNKYLADGKAILKEFGEADLFDADAYLGSIADTDEREELASNEEENNIINDIASNQEKENETLIGMDTLLPDDDALSFAQEEEVLDLKEFMAAPVEAKDETPEKIIRKQADPAELAKEFYESDLNSFDEYTVTQEPDPIEIEEEPPRPLEIKNEIYENSEAELLDDLDDEFDAMDAVDLTRYAQPKQIEPEIAEDAATQESEEILAAAYFGSDAQIRQEESVEEDPTNYIEEDFDPYAEQEGDTLLSDEEVQQYFASSPTEEETFVDENRNLKNAAQIVEENEELSQGVQDYQKFIPEKENYVFADTQDSEENTKEEDVFLPEIGEKQAYAIEKEEPKEEQIELDRYLTDDSGVYRTDESEGDIASRAAYSAAGGANESVQQEQDYLFNDSLVEKGVFGERRNFRTAPSASDGYFEESVSESRYYSNAPSQAEVAAAYQEGTLREEETLSRSIYLSERHSQTDVESDLKNIRLISDDEEEYKEEKITLSDTDIDSVQQLYGGELLDVKTTDEKDLTHLFPKSRQESYVLKQPKAPKSVDLSNVELVGEKENEFTVMENAKLQLDEGELMEYTQKVVKEVPKPIEVAQESKVEALPTEQQISIIDETQLLSDDEENLDYFEQEEDADFEEDDMIYDYDYRSKVIEQFYDEEIEEEDGDEEEEEEAEDEEISKDNNATNEEGESVLLGINPRKRKQRLTLQQKLCASPKRVKEFLDEIVNHALSYKNVHARFTKYAITLRQSGDLIAKISLHGKTLKLYLAIASEELDHSKYNVIDVSEKKSFAETPTMMKVRSMRAVKFSKELLDYIMSARGISLKKKFERQDYVSMFKPDLTGRCSLPVKIKDTKKVTDAEIECLIQTELLNTPPSAKIIVIEAARLNVFENGEVVDEASLREKGLIKFAGKISVEIRASKGTLSKSLTVKANEISLDAAKMIALAGGSIIKLIVEK